MGSFCQGLLFYIQNYIFAMKNVVKECDNMIIIKYSNYYMVI